MNRLNGSVHIGDVLNPDAILPNYARTLFVCRINTRFLSLSDTTMVS